MSGEQPERDAGTSDDLLPQLSVIEEQPLGERAPAYNRLYERLRDRLEGGDGAAGDE